MNTVVIIINNKVENGVSFENNSLMKYQKNSNYLKVLRKNEEHNYIFLTVHNNFLNLFKTF